MSVELTVKEYAALERVDERTVKRWLAKGAVPFRRTAGGGIRIAVASDSKRAFVLGEVANEDNTGH